MTLKMAVELAMPSESETRILQQHPDSVPKIVEKGRHRYFRFLIFDFRLLVIASFSAERDNRINPAGATGGKPRGENRDDGKNEADDQVGLSIQPRARQQRSQPQTAADRDP